MRIILTISYDGTAYCGWQRQKNGISVQEVIENAIIKLTGEKISLIASGRTDAGVHANGQVAHFDTLSTIPPQKFYLAINSLLPDDIRILSSSLAKDDFHARYSAKRKTYVYNFYLSHVILPLKDRYATRIENFNVETAQAVLDQIVGTHDFKCFLSSGSEVKTTVRTIYSATACQSGDDISLEITGNGFLYNMVRIIAGTVIAACENKITVEDVKRALLSGDRNVASKTAPAKGLCLKSVEYI